MICYRITISDNKQKMFTRQLYVLTASLRLGPRALNDGVIMLLIYQGVE